MAKQPIASLALTLLAAAGLAAPPAGAQRPPPGINQARQPVFSPYLNLLRGDNDPALNYFGLVKPQIDFRSSLQQVEQEQATLESRQQDLANALKSPPGLPPTGHASGFQTQSKYFMRMNPPGGASRTTGSGAGLNRSGPMTSGGGLSSRRR